MAIFWQVTDFGLVIFPVFGSLESEDSESHGLVHVTLTNFSEVEVQQKLVIVPRQLDVFWIGNVDN